MAKIKHGCLAACDLAIRRVYEDMTLKSSRSKMEEQMFKEEL